MISRRRGHTATYHIRAANTNVGVEPRVEQHAELAVLTGEGPEVQVPAKPIQPRRDEAPHRRRQRQLVRPRGKAIDPVERLVRPDPLAGPLADAPIAPVRVGRSAGSSLVRLTPVLRQSPLAFMSRLTQPLREAQPAGRMACRRAGEVSVCPDARTVMIEISEPALKAQVTLNKVGQVGGRIKIVKDGKVAVHKPLPATIVPHPTIVRRGGRTIAR